ncbi:MAG: MBL fold metallo-hydrolase [Rhodocyclales bacterium]|nr:MBL fold metallo-hydrolase [Rhodocyclales bacterium]
MISDIGAAAELVILDVGHGNAAVLHERHTTVVVDTGCRSHLLEYLTKRKITSIDLVILSHSDQDHIAGLIGILGAEICVKLVLVNSDPDKASAIWRDLVFALEDARRRGEVGFEVGLSSRQLTCSGLGRCKMEVSGPTPELAALGVGALDRQGRKITSNSISACIRVMFDDRPVALLAGDVDDVALCTMLEADQDLKASILVFPHHGGLPGKVTPGDFAQRLLTAVAPTTVIFSVGRGKHNNPRPEVVGAAIGQRKEMNVVCTQLSVSCSEQAIAAGVSPPSAVFSAGAAAGICCAGSICIDLQTSSIVAPNLVAHQAFVDMKVPTPLCRTS